MEVIPEWPPTLAVMLVIPFCVALAALHFILFKPLLAYMEGRDRAIGEARDEAADLSSQIDERVAALQEKLDAARQEISEQRATARGKALEEEQRIIATARGDAEQKLAAAVQSVAAEREVASRTLRETADSLSRDIATSVLGRPVQPQETL